MNTVAQFTRKEASYLVAVLRGGYAIMNVCDDENNPGNDNQAKLTVGDFISALEDGTAIQVTIAG